MKQPFGYGEMIPLRELKKGDWSLNLEDGETGDGDSAGELVSAAVEAVFQTKRGHYVNIITPEEKGSPEEWFLPSLRSRLAEEKVEVDKLLYIGECGCGGHITRVYR